MHIAPLPLEDAFAAALSAFTAKQTSIMEQVHAVMDFIESAQYEDLASTHAAQLAAAMRRAGYKGCKDPDYCDPHPAPMAVGDYASFPGDPKKSMLMHAFESVQSGRVSAQRLLDHDIGFTFAQFIHNMDRYAQGDVHYVLSGPRHFLKDALDSHVYYSQAALNAPHGAVRAPSYMQ